MIACTDHLGREFKDMKSMCVANGIDYSKFYRLTYKDISIQDAVKQLVAEKNIKEPPAEHKKNLIEDLDRIRQAAGKLDTPIKPFKIESNRLSKEYRRWILYQYKNIKSTSIKDKDEVIRRRNELMAGYQKIDQYWLGALDDELLGIDSPYQTNDAKNKAKRLLESPQGIIADMIEFNNKYKVTSYGR